MSLGSYFTVNPTAIPFGDFFSKPRPSRLHGSTEFDFDALQKLNENNESCFTCKEIWRRRSIHCCLQRCFGLDFFDESSVISMTFNIFIGFTAFQMTYAWALKIAKWLVHYNPEELYPGVSNPNDDDHTNVHSFVFLMVYFCVVILFSLVFVFQALGNQHYTPRIAKLLSLLVYVFIVISLGLLSRTNWFFNEDRDYETVLYFFIYALCMLFSLKHFVMYNMYHKSEGRTRVIKKYLTDGVEQKNIADQVSELTLGDSTTAMTTGDSTTAITTLGLPTFQNFHEEVNDAPALTPVDDDKSMVSERETIRATWIGDIGDSLFTPVSYWDTTCCKSYSQPCAGVYIPSRLWIAILLTIFLEAGTFSWFYENYWDSRLDDWVWSRLSYPTITGINMNNFLKFLDDYVITSNNRLTPEQMLSIYGYDGLPSNFTSGNFTFPNGTSIIDFIPNATSISVTDVIREQIQHYPENIWSNMDSHALTDIWNMFEWGDNRSLISRSDAGYVAIGIRIFYILHNIVVVYSCILSLLCYRKVYLDILNGQCVPRDVYPVMTTVRFIGNFVWNALVGAWMICIGVTIFVTPMVLTKFWEDNNFMDKIFPKLVWFTMYYVFHHFVVQRFLVGYILTSNGGMPTSERNTTILRAIVLLLEVFYFPIMIFVVLFRFILLWLVYIMWYLRLDWSMLPSKSRYWDDVHASFVTVAKIAAHRYFEEHRMLQKRRDTMMPVSAFSVAASSAALSMEQESRSLADVELQPSVATLTHEESLKGDPDNYMVNDSSTELNRKIED